MTTIGNPLLWLLSTLTGRVWLNVFIIVCTLMTFAMSSTASAKNMLAAVTTPTPKVVTIASMFKIDSAASDHVSGTFTFFRDFDETTAKEFEVVHSEPVHSLGTGAVDLIALDTDGGRHHLTLKDVHFIPGQAMNLISVSKAIENAGVQNPDFVNLNSVIDGKTFKMVHNNGTFSLDAQTSTTTL